VSQNSLKIARAMKNGDIAKLEAFFAAGLDPRDTTEGDRWNLLHRALVSVMRSPPPETVALLIHKGVDVNARDREGWSPLQFAARTKDLDVVKLLLEAGADPNHPNNKGITALHQSLLKTPLNVALVELFLQYGANPDMTHGTCCARRFMEAVACAEKEQILALFDRYRK
jgi:ankyrin repeat protein